MSETSAERAARIAHEFDTMSPADFMDAREADSDRRQPAAASHGWAFSVGTITTALAIAIAVLVLVILASGALPAQAQTRCRPHDAYIATLAQLYGEHVVVTAIITDTAGNHDGKPAAVMELIASDKGVSWTMIVTDPNGCARSFLTGVQLAIKAPGRKT